MLAGINDSAKALQQRDVTISVTVPTPISIPSNRLATLSLSITNTSQSPKSLHPRMVLPEGWKVVIPDSPFTLEPGATSNRLLTLRSPAKTRAGEY